MSILEELVRARGSLRFLPRVNGRGSFLLASQLSSSKAGSLSRNLPTLKQTRSGRSVRLTQGSPSAHPLGRNQVWPGGKLVTNLGIPHITLSSEELLGGQSRASQ